MNDIKACPPGYKRKDGRCDFLKNVGYNSHGFWSTLGDIRRDERERGNPFPRIKYPPSTKAIWITFKKRNALRYALSADRWDDIDAGKPLTDDEKIVMREEIKSIILKKTDKIITDDGDGGYLLVRPE